MHFVYKKKRLKLIQKSLRSDFCSHRGTIDYLFTCANSSVKTAGLVVHQHTFLKPPPPSPPHTHTQNPVNSPTNSFRRTGMLSGQVSALWPAHMHTGRTVISITSFTGAEWESVGALALSCASGWQTSSRVFVLSRGAPDHSAERRRRRRRRRLLGSGVFSLSLWRSPEYM